MLISRHDVIIVYSSVIRWRSQHRVRFASAQSVGSIEFTFFRWPRFRIQSWCRFCIEQFVFQLQFPINHFSFLNRFSESIAPYMCLKIEFYQWVGCLIISYWGRIDICLWRLSILSARTYSFRINKARCVPPRSLERFLIGNYLRTSVTRKNHQNVYKSCPKMISLEK